MSTIETSSNLKQEYTEQVAPAADTYGQDIPETPCPTQRSQLSNGKTNPTLMPAVFYTSDFSKQKQQQSLLNTTSTTEAASHPSNKSIKPIPRREIADDFADFEMIGRKLSNVNLGCSENTNVAVNGNDSVRNLGLLSNVNSLHRAFQTQVPEYQFNAMKQLRSSLCDGELLFSFEP